MFRKNKKHQQQGLITNVSQLPDWQRKRLEQSWAGTFYRETFCRIDEAPFAILYSDIPSRPNTPINVLVGLEYMKAGFGWSDEEMQDEFLYNVQVRYALGYQELGVGEFDLRTVYNFRRRVSAYMQKSGVHLINQAFEQVTDEQMEAFALKTGKQRMDSTQVESNIRHHGRLQLLVEVLQRVHRMLTGEDQARYAELFEPYLHGHPGHYVRRLKKEEYVEHIVKTGALMHILLEQLRERYQEEKVYEMLVRVFGEHFRLEHEQVKAKEGKELSACSLQSPDDWEATVREKGDGVHIGYVANITETCDEQNPFQLITKVQVTSNHVDDPQLLLEALPNLAERTKIDTLFSDGGFGSPEVDQALFYHDVTLFQSAIRGHPPAPDKLSLSDFRFEIEKTGRPLNITCPCDQRVAVRYGNQGIDFVAEFDPATCQSCQLVKICPAKPGRRNPMHFLYFSGSEAHVAVRRQRIAEFKTMTNNPRAALEATVRAVKHPFRHGKLPVRGRFRVFYMMVGSAIMNNVRRIQRYMYEQNRLEMKRSRENLSQDSFCFPFKALVWSLFQPFLSILCW